MNEAFLVTLGIVLVGIPGGALMALAISHPPEARRMLSSGWEWLRKHLPEPPRYWRDIR